MTALIPAGPLGMVVGSFTSVSLEPALVAFLPDRTSKTWPNIEDAGHFHVNLLAERQLSVSARRLASKADNIGFDAHSLSALRDLVFR